MFDFSLKSGIWDVRKKCFFEDQFVLGWILSKDVSRHKILCLYVISINTINSTCIIYLYILSINQLVNHHKIKIALVHRIETLKK